MSKKKLAGYSLTTEAIEAVQREARIIAMKRDTRVSASGLIEELIRKLIIEKRKKGK